MKLFSTFFLLFLLVKANTQQLIDSNVMTKMSRIDSFVSKIPDVSLKDLTTFILKYRIAPDQKGLAMFPKTPELRNNTNSIFNKNHQLSNIEIQKRDSSWSLFCESEYGLINTDSLRHFAAQYFSTSNKLSSALNFFKYLYLSYPYPNFITSNAFYYYKKNIDSLSNLNLDDSLKALYYTTLGDIYFENMAFSPERRASAFYYFERARFLIDTYKSTPDILNNTPPTFSASEKKLKYPELKELLFHTSVSLAEIFYNSSTYDPKNTLAEFILRQNYFIRISETINKELLSNGRIPIGTYLNNQYKYLKILTEIKYPDFSTTSNDLFELSTTVDILESRISYFGQRDYINDFLTVYSLGNYFFNDRQYSKALKLFIYSLQYKLQNQVPDNIEKRENDDLIKMILWCSEILKISSENIVRFNNSLPQFLLQVRMGGNALNNHLGFDELDKYHILRILDKENQARSLLIKYIQSTFNKLELLEKREVAIPLIRNFIEANYLLGPIYRKHLYLSFKDNHDTTGDVKKIYIDVFLDSSPLYNWSTDVVGYYKLFQTLKLRINDELFLEEQKKASEEVEKRKVAEQAKLVAEKNLRRVLYFASLTIGVVTILGIVYKGKKDSKLKELRHRMQIDAKKKEIDVITFQSRIYFHNLNNDQTTLENLVSDGDLKKVKLYNEKYSEYLKRSKDNWESSNISLDNCFKSLECYYLAKKVRHPNLDLRVNKQIKNPEDVIFLPSVLETLFHNSLYRGFKSKDYSGIVSIEFYTDNTYLYCAFKDNGRPPEDEGVYLSRKNSGLNMLKARIEGLYFERNLVAPPDYFTIQPINISKGTIVKIKLPYEKVESINC